MDEAKEKNMPTPLYTYRGKVTKGEAIRYISHLDYADMIQRAICRTKLPAAYSEGFNPHLKIAFASALAVGVTSEAEYMDFALKEPLSEAEVSARLSAQLPTGVTLSRLRRLTGRHQALMAAVDQADYEITLPDCCEEGAVRRTVQAFNDAETCLFRRSSPKKTREIEVKQYVKGDVTVAWAGGTARLTMAIRITPTGSVKPGEVLSVLCAAFDLPGDAAMAAIHRRALWSGGRSPMDAD